MPADSVVSPRAFAHISVRARNLEESIGWYSTVFGLRVALRNAEQAFTTFDEEHHRVTYFPRPEMGEAAKNLGGFDHMALSYASLDELLHNYRRLKLQGITPRSSVRDGPAVSFHYLDPSGLALELMASVDGAQESKLPDDEIVRPSALAHAVLKTTRYEEMIEWYATVLGCRVRLQNGRAASLSYDGEECRVAIVREKELVAPRDTFGFDHCALEYPTMKDLAIHTYARLKEKGILPYWCTNHGMTTSMYYADPDLNRIELQVDNFKTKAECWRYITGPDFARNPIGIDLHPDDLVAMVKGGATYDALARRGAAHGADPFTLRPAAASAAALHLTATPGKLDYSNHASMASSPTQMVIGVRPSRVGQEWTAASVR